MSTLNTLPPAPPDALHLHASPNRCRGPLPKRSTATPPHSSGPGPSGRGQTCPTAARCARSLLGWLQRPAGSKLVHRCTLPWLCNSLTAHTVDAGLPLLAVDMSLLGSWLLPSDLLGGWHALPLHARASSTPPHLLRLACRRWALLETTGRRTGWDEAQVHPGAACCCSF